MSSKKTYSELLRHPKWQMKRLEILSRDNAKCRLCDGTENELHVHHKNYKRGKKPWEYENDSLITYCKFCHLVIEYTKGWAAWDIYRIHIPKKIDTDFHITIYFFDKDESSHSMGFFRYEHASKNLIPLIAVMEESIEKALKIFNHQRSQQ